MRLESLNLIAYGPFTERHLEFPRAFTIVYGLNETGKTSALRALADGLYGIPAQTSDSFIHPYGDLRIGLTLASGANRLEFIRRKTRQQSLRAADDTSVVQDAELEKLLQGLTRTDFETMFGISHERLVRGGREIAAGEGEVGKILFQAAAGVIGLQTTLDRLDQRAGELYAPRASSKSIHLHLRQIKEASLELRQKQVGVAAFEKNREAMAEVALQVATCKTGLDEACRESERMRRIQKALPTIAGRKQALAEWQELAGVPKLGAEFGTRLASGGRAVETANQSLKESETEIARSAEAIAALVIPADLLAEDDRIRYLYEQKGAIEKSKQDCARREGDLEKTNQTIRKQLDMVKPGFALAQAPSLEPGVIVRKHVQELAALAPQLEAQRRSLDSTLASASGKVSEYDLALNGLPELPDTAPVERMVNRGRRELDFAKAQQLRRGIASHEDRLRTALKALPLWSGSGEDLEAAPVPGGEFIEEMRAELQAHESAERAAKESLAEIEKNLGEAKTERAAVIAAHTVPTLNDLRGARALRELGWSAIQKAWRDAAADAPESAEFLARTGARDLTTGYGDAVKQADTLADRMREAAEKVERVAMLDVQIAACEQRRAAASLELAEVLSESEQARARWTDAWSSVGIKPSSPAAMTNWMRKRDAIVQLLSDTRELRSQLTEWEKREAEIGAALRSLLAAFGSAEQAADTAGWLDLAEEILSRAKQVASQRLALQSDRQAQVREIDRVERAIADLERQRAAWTANWSEALQQAGIEPGASPAAAGEYLSAVQEIQNDLQKAEDLSARIQKMLADSLEFEAAVGGLVDRLDPELKRYQPEQAIVHLHQALTSAKENLKLRQREEGARKDWEKKKIKAGGDAERAAAEIALLCREAGVEDAAAARTVSDRAVRRRQLEEKLGDFQERLLLVCGGKTIPEFLAEAEVLDADSVPRLLEALERRAAELRNEQETLDTRRRGLEAEALAFENADGAATAQHISGLIGSLSGDVEEYVRLKTASMVLRKAIEQYRERNQGPVLDRAGHLFSVLTRGSFSGLRVEGLEGRTVLLGVRGDGKTVEVSGMSDGTCDQLYLALRVASLEHYFVSHEPMPFIVDDVLLSFDDERAASALSVLKEMSAKTQIVFFTHHRHLVELAKDAAKVSVVEIG